MPQICICERSVRVVIVLIQRYEVQYILDMSAATCEGDSEVVIVIVVVQKIALGHAETMRGKGG